MPNPRCYVCGADGAAGEVPLCEECKPGTDIGNGYRLVVTPVAEEDAEKAKLVEKFAAWQFQGRGFAEAPPPSGGDDTAQIQAAVDRAAAEPSFYGLGIGHLLDQPSSVEEYIVVLSLFTLPCGRGGGKVPESDLEGRESEP